MNTKELAEKLNNTEYGKMDKDLIELAKEHNLVIVSGYSDDLIDLSGAIRGEIDCSDGVHLDADGLVKSDCDDEDCPYFEKIKSKAKKIHALWCSSGGPAWSYRTKIPHEKFNVMEDGKLWCEGIVFSMDDLGE